MKVRIHSDTRPSAQRCIYCGSTNSLTDEHIIPFGLWGRIIFPNASCPDCANKINVFETQIQQRHLGAFRQRARIPLRKRRPRKYKFQLSFGTSNPSQPAPAPVEIGGDEMPRSFLLFRFMPPQIFVGPWSRQSEVWMHHDTGDMRELMYKYQNPAVFIGEYHNDMFCRLIAKIGHGLAVAYMPAEVLDTFHFLLPDLILDGADNYHRLVGGDFAVPPLSDLMHEWDISNAVCGNTEYLFARIRLFACLGTPRYHAVVASRPLGKITVTNDPVRFSGP